MAHTVGVYLLSVKVEEKTGIGISADDVRIVAKSKVTKGQDVTGSTKTTDSNGNTIVKWPPEGEAARSLDTGQSGPSSPYELLKVSVQDSDDEVSFNISVAAVEENIEGIANGAAKIGKFALITLLVPTLPILGAFFGLKETEEMIDGIVDEGLEFLGMNDRLMDTIAFSATDEKLCDNTQNISSWFTPRPGDTISDQLNGYTFENEIENHDGKWTVSMCVIRNCPEEESEDGTGGEDG